MIKETQRFTENWVIYLVALIPLVTRMWFKDEFEIISIEGLILIIIGALAIIVGWFIRLDSEFSEEGIIYRLFPLQLKERNITWDEVQEVHIRKYSPILEYGGWGLRGFDNRNKAVNISGNIGVQLQLKNGNRLLIGTQLQDKVRELLLTKVHGKLVS